MAAELGADVQLAKRAGLLHDIGKAVDHEAEGTHVTLGGELAQQVPREHPMSSTASSPTTTTSNRRRLKPCWFRRRTRFPLLVRVRAVRASKTTSSVLEKLEEIATSFAGVEKCYAIQSGREVRIMVKPDDVTDDGTKILAKEIAKRIEKEMEYPGQIRVNVIRETRSMEYAK